MNKKTVGIISLILYSAVIMFSSFFIGRNVTKVNTEETVKTNYNMPEEEEYYTVRENDNRLSVFKDGELLMSLDTNVDILPSIVRSQLKKGIEFKPSDLPEILEAFAE